MPLQLVGLAGLDNNQALCAPVRPVRFISPSARNHEAGSSGSGAVRLTRSKHGPDDPCVLIGDGNRCPIEAASLPKLVDPLVRGIGLVGAGSHHGSGAVDEKAT